jgi:putative inorganic carbon (hco3(-)) transporter
MRRFLANTASPTDLAMALLLIMVGVSVIVSPLPARSWAALPPLALGLLLYVCLAKLPLGPNLLLWVGRGLALAIVPIALLTPAAMTPPRSVPWSPLLTLLPLSMQETFNPNVIAGALVLLLPFGAVQVWSFRARHRVTRWLGRAIGLLITGACLGVLWATQSRGAYGAVVVVMLTLAVVARPRSARWTVLPLIAGGLLVGTVVGWQHIAGMVIDARLARELAMREEIWARALAITQDLPLAGVGLGCFEPVVAALYPMTLHPGGTATHAHNVFLQVAMDLGLPGLIAYLAILVLSGQLTWIARQELARDSVPGLHGLATACLLALIGMVVHGLIDSAVWGNKGAFIPWVVMGLGAGLYRHATTRRERVCG